MDQNLFGSLSHGNADIAPAQQPLQPLSPQALDLIRKKYLSIILDPASGSFNDTRTADQAVRDYDETKPDIQRLKAWESYIGKNMLTVPEGTGKYRDSFEGYQPFTLGKS